jgi:hypothetical protein
MLRAILSNLEPAIAYADVLQGLSAPLEPFVLAQKRAATKKDKDSGAKDKEVDWRRRKREGREKAAMAIGVYQVEELIL